jgi:large subunit ribosomal protein L25
VTSKVLHIDFHEVNLKEKTTAHVPVVLVGEAEAVKSKEGTLLSLMHEVEIEALPMDIPEKIEVDVTKLAKVGESIKISDVAVSDKVKIKTAADSDVVKVAPLVSKEAQEMAAADAAAATAAAAAAPEAGAAPASAANTSVPAAEKKEEASKK